MKKKKISIEIWDIIPTIRAFGIFEYYYYVFIFFLKICISTMCISNYIFMVFFQFSNEIFRGNRVSSRKSSLKSICR